MKQEEIQKAVQVLKAGGVVVYPTDTAYGLAVDATSLAAVKKMYKVKGRGFNKPIHVILPYGRNTVPYSDNAIARKLWKCFWPGPLTIVLPLKARGKSWQMLSAKTGTIGIRFPDNSTAQGLVQAFGKPITATSANVSGKPDTYSIAEVKKQFAKSNPPTGGKPDFYLDGGKLPKVKPSTVVAIVNNNVKILRAGPVTEKQIKTALA